MQPQYRYGQSLWARSPVRQNNQQVVEVNGAVAVEICLHIDLTPRIKKNQQVAKADVGRAVGFGDLTTLLSSWGPCARCPEDLDGDDIVGFSDLLDVLTAWGPC